MFKSKISPTSRPSAAMSGEPELPPTQSTLVATLNGVARSRRVRAACPFRRQGEWLDAGGPFIEPCECREGINLAAARIDKARNRSIGQAQRECGVGRDPVAQRREAGLCQPRLCVGHRAGNFVAVTLADRLRVGLDGGGEADQRIGRRHDRGLAARPQRPAHRRVGETGTAHQARGKPFGQFATEHPPHGGMIDGQILSGLAEPQFQSDTLHGGLDGARRSVTQAGGDALSGLAPALAARTSRRA